jgi:2-methylcitrate dehydratase
MTASMRYDAISEEAREIAKRLIIDALACGIGGIRSPTGRSALSYARKVSQKSEATLIGSSDRVSCSAAIIANQAMIRYLDYNDDLPIPIGPGDLVAVHPSGALPVALAVAEKTRASGTALIESMVAGYEVAGRLLAGFKVSLEVRGLHHGSTLAYAAVAMAGRLLGLSADQIAHGMGIAGSLTVGLDILDAEGEEYTMTKNLADGMISERGYTAALLAQEGFTGPLRIIEGNKGFAHSALGGQNMFVWGAHNGERGNGQEWILSTVIKALPAEATTHGHLTATCWLVREYKLKQEMVDRIVVRTNKRTHYHTGDPIKKFPRNKETADHSSYFLTAMALLEGAITPRIYRESNYSDPLVRNVIGKIELEYGPEFDAIIPAGQVTMHLKDGRTVTKRIEKHELAGEPTKRMTDIALRAKFVECAAGIIPDARVDEIIDRCLRLDKIDDIAGLMSLMRAAEH